MLLPLYLIARVALGLVQAPSLKPTAPEGLWPTSVAGWAALIGFALLVIEKSYKGWRKTQDPIERKIDDAFTACIKKIDETVEHFQEEVERIEKKVEASVTQNAALEVERRNAFREAVSHDINGWSARITETASDLERLGEAFDVQARAFIKFESESKADRMNINSRLSVVESEVRSLAGAQGQMELRLTRALNEAEGRLAGVIERAVAAIRKP